MDEGKLIDGALRVIEETGLRNLTLASVARAAGVSRASVYRTFAGREDLIDAVVGRELATMESILSSRLRFSDDARATVIAVVREVLAYFDDHRPLRAVLRHDAADLLPYLISDDTAHPTLVDLVCALVLPRIENTALAAALRPDAPLAVEHMVRVLYAHLLIPSAALTDRDVAELVADAIITEAIVAG